MRPSECQSVRLYARLLCYAIYEMVHMYVMLYYGCLLALYDLGLLYAGLSSAVMFLCLSVCLSVCLFVCTHIYAATQPAMQLCDYVFCHNFSNCLCAFVVVVCLHVHIYVCM